MKRGSAAPGNEGETGEGDIKRDRDKAKATIRRCLENAAQLDQAKRAKYRAAAEAVLDAMGPVALKRWNENVKSITFYPDTESINEFVRSLGHAFARATDVRGLCIRDLSQPWLCGLCLNGGAETGEHFPRTTRDVYAHEFSHAVDLAEGETARLSSTVAWQMAWSAEGADIQGRLHLPNRGAREGFGNFAIIAWNYPEDARRHYPACWTFWKRHGLV